ncbi:P-loop containing nucleoside triphosphate hydrolase protein [Lentithecium fluviatile CBS 122367]|uniref:RNA helicase n=1 Tax=Lentithecium fluviatile CBS 122367 TaxID=1168545 RepID=A0A6G1ISZ9_9PLEO|nr:P-loop containing nucleoside triphosphate hydrolase protein [Lentithecium fluviatile CBS 122367]
MRSALLAPLRLRRPYRLGNYLARASAFASNSRQLRSHSTTHYVEERTGDSLDPFLSTLKHTQTAVGKKNHAAPKSKAGERPQPSPQSRTTSGGDRTKRPKTDRPKVNHAKEYEQRRRSTPKRNSQTGAPGGPRNSPLITEEYIKQHLSLPSQDEYPDAPNELFQWLTQTPERYDLKQLFKNKVKIPHEAITRLDQGARYSIPAELYNGVKIPVFGEGSDKRQAARACFLHLVARLHEMGLLREFWGKPTIPLVRQDLSGPSPKVAVFEYAAGFKLIPRFTTKPISRDILHKVQEQGDVKAKFQCTIELPEQEIVAIGAGTTYFQAENAASARFEELAAERDTNDVRLSIKASTMDDFRNFWDHSKGVLTASVTETRGKGEKQHRAQALLSGQPIGEVVTMGKKSEAEDLAILTAAIAIGKEDPDLLPDFDAALRNSGGKILRKVRPMSIPMSDEVLGTMGKVSTFLRSSGALKPVLPSSSRNASNSEARSRRVRDFTDHNLRNKHLQEAFRNYQESSATELMRSKREELPINQHRAEIVDLVSENPFTVVVGATGSGKTTQVPQMFLEAASEAGRGASCNVIVTQPRRIAATSVARRVANERDEQLRDSVGYIVRHNSAPPRQDGSILFCTTGILLQQLQNDPDQVFDTTSHILLDEVHERDILLDFLLVVLKKALKERRAANKSVPKVVLMSATMNTQLFSNYFGVRDAEGRVVPCPSINVPGRLFPVKNRYLREIHSELESNYSRANLSELLNEKDTARYLSKELQPIAVSSSSARPGAGPEQSEDDFDPDDSLAPVGLVAATVAHVAKTTTEGAILVFLPGHNEILTTNNLLTRRPVFGVNFTDQTRYKLFVLHSSTPADAQAAVFDPVPEGCRKVILSTNIAETSVTIPDVQHVVDSGKHREKRYDSVNRISALKSAWISKANAKQRAGRAGRVQNGNYYGLYTEERLERLKITGKAEMLRADLQDICLDVKAHGFRDSIGEFLSQALEPPNPTNVRSAVSTLQSIEALDENEDLTPLGELLASMPVQPALGKMIVLGIIFQCLDPILILSALSESRNLLMKPSGKRSEWERIHERFLSGSQSEHIAQINAFKLTRRVVEERGNDSARGFANLNFINMAAYEQTRRAAQDIEQILVQNHLIPYTTPDNRHAYQFGDKALNVNSDNVPLIKALALVGFAPNLAINTFGRWFRTSNQDMVAVHPKSIMASKRNDVDYGGAMFTYSTLFSSDDGFLSMRDTTEVSHASTLLFGGKLSIGYESGRKSLVLDGWLPFKVGSVPQHLKVVHQFRQNLDTLLSNAFRELTSHRLKNMHAPEDQKTYFADDAVRNAFARGLVGILGQFAHKSKIQPKFRPQRLSDSGDPISSGRGNSSSKLDRPSSGRSSLKGRSSFDRAWSKPSRGVFMY